MELQRIVWHWDTLVERLRDSEPDLYVPLRRSCRPLEAERRADGVLVVAVGVWLRVDLAALRDRHVLERLGKALGRMLEDRLRIVVAPWPGGIVDRVDEEASGPPDMLAGLPQDAVAAAASCESPVQRYFYARAYRRGLRPRCQYPLDRFRLDFALPERRIAAEVVGWDWDRARGGGLPREREEQLGVTGWRLRWFSGSQVLSNVERCLDEWEAMTSAGQGLMTRQFLKQRPQVGRGSQPRQPRKR